MKRTIATILTYITITAVLLLGFGDILLLPENTKDLVYVHQFTSVPTAFAGGELGSGDGGPHWTGQGVCITSGQIIFTGVIDGNDANFFCCTTDADCGGYGEFYSGGKSLPSPPTCYTGETASLYCPLNTSTGQTLSINKSASSLTVDLFTPIQYTIQVGMTGYGSATNTAVFDTFASGFIFSGFISTSPGYTSGSVSGDLMTWSIGTMTSGFIGSLVYEGYYTTSGVKTNTAVYRSCSGGKCSDSAVITVLYPIVTIEKYVIVGGNVYTGPILNGMTGSYRVVISNIGSGAARDMSVLDTLPTFFTYQGSTTSTGLVAYDTGLHSLTWDTFSLAAGSSLQWYIDGMWSVSVSGVITNFAEIENTGYCTVSGGNCTTQVSSIGLAPITGQCNTSVITGYYSGVDSLPSTGSLCVSGTLSGLVQVASGRTWNCIGSNSGGSESSCSLQIRYCGDTTVQSGEQCDDGNTTGGDGCSATCQYEAPSCALALSPNAGVAPLVVTGSWSISGWMLALSIDWGDTSSDLFPTSPIAHTYATTGVRTVILLVKNNLSGSTLTGLCTGLVTISAAAITGSCGTLSGDIQYDFNNSGDAIDSGTVGLCNVGTVSGFVYNTGTHTWQWSCYGINSGANVSCNASERYCGDGLAGTGNGYSNQEQCDDGNTTSGDGCSVTCQYETPSCTITVSGSGFLPVNATGVRSLSSRITATQLDLGNNSIVSNPTSPAGMYYGTAGNYTVTLTVQNNVSGSTLTGQCTGFIQVLGPPITGQCNTSVMTGYYSGVDSLPSTGSLCVSGTLSGLVQVASGRTWNCIGSNSGGSESSCSLQIRYCGDTTVQSGEQCDDGNTTGGDGCSATCQYEAPSCALALSPNAGVAPLVVTGSWSISGWMLALSIDWGDTSSDLFPTSPIAHTYATTGVRTVILLVKNNLSGSTLTGLCTGLVTISAAAITGSCGTLSGDIQYDFNNSGDAIDSGTVGLCNVGTVSGFVYNTGTHTWQWYCYGLHSGANVSCNASERYCGDGLAGTGNGYSNQEQCDDGNTTSGDGCSATCQYEIPSCTIVLSPNVGSAPLLVTGTWSLSGWISGLSLDRGDSNIDITPTSPLAHTYITTGIRTVSLLVKNNLSGSTLTGLCTGVVQISTSANAQCDANLMTGYYSGTNSLPSPSTLCAVGSVYGLNQYNTGRSRNCAGIGSGSNQSGCALSIFSCGDSVVQSGYGEQCDTQTGCNNNTCQRYTGSCTQVAFQVTSNSGVVPFTTTAFFATPVGFQVSTLDRGDSSVVNTPSSGAMHTYNTTGLFVVSLLFNHLGLSGSQLTCTTSVTTTAVSPNSNNNNNNIGGGGGNSPLNEPLPSFPVVGNNLNNTSGSPVVTFPPVNPNTAVGNMDSSSLVGMPDSYQGSPTTDTTQDDLNNLLVIDLNQYNNTHNLVGSPLNPLDSSSSTTSPSPINLNNSVNSINPNNSLPLVTNDALNVIDIYAWEQSQNTPYVFIPGEHDLSNEGGPNTDFQFNFSLSSFSLGLNSLEYLYRCQGSQFGTATLQACIQKLPYDAYCTVIEKKSNRVSINKQRIRRCIKQVEEYFSPYNEVPGALYLDLDLSTDREKSQLIISFLSQFLRIYSYKAVLEPYEPFVMRLEFDPLQIDNASMYGLLAHLGGDEFAQHIIPVPLFKIAQQPKNIGSNLQQLLVQNTTNSHIGSTSLFTTSNASRFSDPLYVKQTYLDTIRFEQSLSLCNWTPTKQVSVAIIDSAFDVTHEDLQKNIIFAKDVANDDDNVAPPQGQSSSPEWGHGTYSAGIIAATTDNNKGLMSIPLNNLKVFVYKATRDDAVSPSDITYGLEALTQAGRTQPDIINVSWGIFSDNDIPILKRLVTKITKQGTTIVASAGNYNSSALFYPAAYPDVIAVGAVDQNKQKAQFSNYGGRVDIAAPGVDIITTAMSNLYTSVDGTSEAAPVVSAGLAYVLGHGGSIDDMFNNLSPVATDLGKGIIDLERACAAMAATYDPDGDTTTFQPSTKTNDSSINFATQSNSMGFSDPFQLMLLLLILVLLLMLWYMRKEIKKIDKS